MYTISIAEENEPFAKFKHKEGLLKFLDTILKEKNIIIKLITPIGKSTFANIDNIHNVIKYGKNEVQIKSKINNIIETKDLIIRRFENGHIITINHYDIIIDWYKAVKDNKLIDYNLYRIISEFIIVYYTDYINYAYNKYNSLPHKNNTTIEEFDVINDIIKWKCVYKENMIINLDETDNLNESDNKTNSKFYTIRNSAGLTPAELVHLHINNIKYSTKQDAYTEATRLANIYPGKTFFIMEAIGSITLTKEEF